MEDRDERAEGKGACLLQRGGGNKVEGRVTRRDAWMKKTGAGFVSNSKTPLTYLVVSMYGIIMWRNNAGQ